MFIVSILVSSCLAVPPEIPEDVRQKLIAYGRSDLNIDKNSLLGLQKDFRNVLHSTNVQEEKNELFWEMSRLIFASSSSPKCKNELEKWEKKHSQYLCALEKGYGKSLTFSLINKQTISSAIIFTDDISTTNEVTLFPAVRCFFIFSCMPSDKISEMGSRILGLDNKKNKIAIHLFPGK